MKDQIWPMLLSRLAACGTLAVLSGALWASDRPALPPLIGPDGNTGPDWRVVGFPKSHTDLPLTRFEPGQADGVTGMQVITDASYGTLVHDGLSTPPRRLQWRWRLDQPLGGGRRAPDLASKEGDDAALKVCVMFRHGLDRVPFWERTVLRVARAVSGEALPAATLCYVWDSAGPAMREGSNPYTRRVRFIVLQGRDAPLSRWISETRDVGADFARLFADELPLGADTPPDQLPRVHTVLVGADSDNTGSRSSGWVTGLGWAP
ncbi:MAG TPA: DUF3047 domain-containing protein [Hydrogenophaga sp.]|uniref:DUF3047 domain-containing protein n=1 Tax=Hydrogenophaga sp. TaxID=1904254 RepID=UPI002C91565F|nr:DUF3047 domain-containing protein [Hydrogenophaga sp.]HMN94685.1 DUF3047 domain-containing protein [Hydrogenophaga sp.]HMP08930.1 DUF3047 domain-containing protein [Hydrogenophaga sp.]